MNQYPASAIKILVVDDDPSILKLVEKFISDFIYFEIYSFTSPVKASEWAKDNQFDLALIDYVMPKMNGLELVKELKNKNPESYFILITAHGKLQIAIEAIQAGISDFITKPINRIVFKIAIGRAANQIFLKRENKVLRGFIKENYGKNLLISQSEEMNAVREKINTFADSNAPVLITGETGVGKEVVARMFHDTSDRRESHFIAVNFSAYAETLLESELFGHEKGAFTGADKQRIGRFEYASSGTILLDEVCEIPLQMQVKLLRVLQEKEFERVGGNKTVKLKARIISSTNRDINEEIKRGRFRKDLFYRLNAIQVHVPPLRSRVEDIQPLATHFLQKFSLIHNKIIASFSDEAINLFHGYAWPGNIRQLENVIDYAVVACDGSKIQKKHLPEEFKKKSPSIQPFIGISAEPIIINNTLSAASGAERSKILESLERNRWVKTETARDLGLTRSQLLYRLKKYRIK